MTKSPYQFDANCPCLVLAPPLEYPAHSGNVAVERKWAQFSNLVPFVDIVGKNTITRYRNGIIESQTVYENPSIKKFNASIATLLHRSHYLIEKFITKEFKSVATQYIIRSEYNLIVLSYIWTAGIMDDIQFDPGKIYCIESHNDEFKWFDDLQKTMINPIGKLVAYLSKKWIYYFLNKDEYDYIFFHVSQADYNGYLKYFPKQRGYVVPIGTDVPENSIDWVSVTDRVRLLFIGSLAVKMNLDAIKIFRDKFYPVIKESLIDKLEIVVAGSYPSNAVINICEKMGWKLYANVSDEDLQRLYQESMFSLLPFHYVTGRKLKILESMANGVPFLATATMENQIDKLIFPCLLSDDPAAWLKRILDVQSDGIDIKSRVNMKYYAAQYSWTEISKKVYRLLNANFGR